MSISCSIFWCAGPTTFWTASSVGSPRNKNMPC
jgi:hypothetical protein